MYLQKLSLINFKNYEQFEIDLSPQINCFVGNNGSGKTNLLDAVFYLSFCKSFLNPIDSQNIKHNTDFFVIQGQYQRKDKEEAIYCGMKRNAKKQFKRNKKDYQKLSEHIGLLPLVIISPNDSVLVNGGSDERRKFMDSVISQYDKPYLETLIRYNKALNQRNTLLKDFYRRGYFSKESLEIWDMQLAELGQKIFEKRRHFIHELMPIFQHYYNFIAQDSEMVKLIYKSQLSDNKLENLLGEHLEKDRVLQHTSVGTHRDDLKLLLENYSMRRKGSQGQQKTYLIAVKLAQFDFLKKISGLTPILLLDDIFDKLDSLRVEQILKLVVNEHFGQIFITDTGNRIEKIIDRVSENYKIFSLRNGEIYTESAS